MPGAFDKAFALSRRGGGGEENEKEEEEKAGKDEEEEEEEIEREGNHAQGIARFT